MKALIRAGLTLATAFCCGNSWAGSIFLTGHDPDFHALLGSNAAGARDINKAAIGYVTDPLANPFATGGSDKFLFVESSISPPGGHVDGEQGIIDSGYVAGTDFEKHDASDLNTELNKLGTKYDAIVIASDFGGILTQAELDILDARSADIITFLNAGGGLYAMAEGDNGAGLTPKGGWFGYLPFIVTSKDKNQNENGDTLTAFGSGLGLKVTDINGNASHNIFTSTGGLNVVDEDATGAILSIATRSQISVGGTTPEPGTIVLLSGGAVLLALRRRRKT